MKSDKLFESLLFERQLFDKLLDEDSDIEKDPLDPFSFKKSPSFGSDEDDRDFLNGSNGDEPFDEIGYDSDENYDDYFDEFDIPSDD